MRLRRTQRAERKFKGRRHGSGAHRSYLSRRTTSAIVRQSKESLGQARIEVDVSRDQVRAAVTSAWTQYIAAVESVAANRDLVSAAQLALDGVIEERNVGQRTTLDVLNQQADVIDAQINLASSERDAVVASYAILSATGASVGRAPLA